ncbi:ornithine cyclodeaminase [Rhizobium sp. BK377]|nr:ornithine cyclodeaminase [Rhizobium sp. BK377]
MTRYAIRMSAIRNLKGNFSESSEGAVMAKLLGDSDLMGHDVMARAIDVMELAFRARLDNKIVSPPRHHVSFGEHGDLVFTVGGILGEAPLAGFRVYDTFQNSKQSQIVAVWSANEGRLKGLVLGERLGAVRTGAIGGVAIRHLSSQNAKSVAVIGSGIQARTQLAAAAAVRAISTVRVYSRDVVNRNAFAQEMQRDLNVEVTPVESVAKATMDADIVICATSSRTPILNSADLTPGVHVNTIGPKLVGEHEIGLDVADTAKIIATDAPEQARAYASPFFLAGTRHENRMIDLAELVSAPGRTRSSPEDITLFCSVGLAGTEVLLASALLDAS